MGYRHNFISSDLGCPTPDGIPLWFRTKYERSIDFKAYHWCSHLEDKRYIEWRDLETDIQKMLRELHPAGSDHPTMRLIFFADESDLEFPDVSHVAITKDEIYEMRPTGWSGDGQEDPPFKTSEFNASTAEMPKGDW